ncbi:MAG: uroporphyrinogen-III C-methyltransferase, partial [Wenzhouxiangellaceae bacterium]
PDPDAAGRDARLESMRDGFSGEIDAMRKRLDELDSSVGVLDRIQRRLSELQEALARPDPELAGQVDALVDRVGRLEAGQNTIEVGLRARVEEIEARVEQRLERLQTRLERVGGDLESADRNLTRRLRLIEVEGLLALGRDRLELVGDVQAARHAWERARERLSSLPEADLLALKSALDREIETLAEYRPASLGQRVEQLFDLAERVPDWPVAGGDGDGGATDFELEAGWANRLGSVFRDLVKVEHLDGAALHPVEIDRKRAQIQTTLRVSAYALARGEPQLSARLVAEVIEMIGQELDADDSRVADALEQLRALSEPLEIGPPPPLKAAQAQLRRLLEASA